MMHSKRLWGRMLGIAGLSLTALLAIHRAPWTALGSQEEHMIILPERVYVETWADQIGLYDRISLHVAIVNDASSEVRLEQIRFFFPGSDGSRYEAVLDGKALEQRLKEGAQAVFVAGEVRTERSLCADLHLAPRGVAALVGNQFALPNGIGASKAIVEAHTRGPDGTGNILREEVPLWRYQPTTRFQFPFSGTWMVISDHGPGPGHPVNSFAYDFCKVQGVSVHRGDGRRLEDWFGYGEPILAVADGMVVEASQAPGVTETPPLVPLPTAEQMGVNGVTITNTLLTLDREGIHYAPGNLRWENLSPEDRGRLNGAYVVIQHSEEEFSFYVHLQPGSLLVNPGDRVKAGQPLGKCGSAGHANGPGLHFQLLYKPDQCAGLPVTFTPASDPDSPPLRLRSLWVVEN